MIYITIISICVVGTLLHFVYEWTHHNKIVAVFAAVNESVWEHIKIAMTPTIIFGIYYFIRYGFNTHNMVALSMCLLTLIILIPLLFYTYTIFTKKSILPIDVVSFYIAIICSQLIFNYFTNMGNIPTILIYIGFILLIIELICYFVLTCHPFKNMIFKDPITNKYGLKGHPCHHDHH